MNKNTYSRGFTLIEAIVVIGIIALLLNIGLPKLIDAKIRSERTAIQTSLWSYRTEAQNYWNANQKFGLNTSIVTTCPSVGSPSNTFLDGLSDKMNSFSSKIQTTLSCYIGANGTNYALFAFIPLESDPSIKAFCVDSTGYFGFRSIPDISDGNCL